MNDAESRPRSLSVGRGRRVLVIDADKNDQKLLAACLQQGDFEVECVANGKDALRNLEGKILPHLIIMEIYQPDLEGHQLGKTLSQHHDRPIIVVSNNNDVDTIVKAIGDFADDYVRKPFDELELLARVQRVLLRTEMHYQDMLASQQRIADDLYVDFDLGHAYLYGERIALTPIEGRILRILHRQQGQIVPYKTLTSEIWQTVDDKQLNALWVHIQRLRTKIESNPREPRHLLTVRGNGYYLTR